MNDKIAAMACFDASSMSRAYAGALAFAGPGGRVMTMPDVVDARIASPSQSTAWTTFFTTTTAEYCGTSPGGVPVVAVLHGTGPMSTLAGIEAAHAHVADDYRRRCRVGRVGLDVFHRILSGHEGPIEVVDLQSTLDRREFPFERLTAEEVLAEPLFVARLGGTGRAERYLERLVADDAAWHEAHDAKRPEGFVLLMEGSSDSPYEIPVDVPGREWSWAPRPIDDGLATAHLLATGMRAAVHGGRGRGTNLSTDVGLQDAGDGARFVGLRAGGRLGDVHPGFDLDAAVAADVPGVWRPFAGQAPAVAPLVRIGDRAFTQVPKTGCSLDTEEPDLEVTDIEEIPGPERIEVQTSGHHLFFRYDVDAVRAVAPRGANAYEVQNVTILDGGRRQSAGIRFFKVDIATGRRVVRAEEVRADPALMLQLTAEAERVHTS